MPSLIAGSQPARNRRLLVDDITTIRDARIAVGLRSGLSQRAIAAQLGISGPAVSQRVSRNPDLRAIRTRNSRREQERLTAYRSELRQTLRQVNRLGRDIERSIVRISEELEASQIDELLGLR
jgi:predicted transcriptional regulator